MRLVGCLMIGATVCTMAGNVLAENLLNNPELNPGLEGGPYDWNLTYEDVRDNFEMVKDEGRNVVRFHVRGKYCSIRQSDIRLKEGSRVRIGAWVRTKDVESRGRIVLYNWLWNGDAGTAAYPRDTNGKWVKHEAEITVPPSIDGHYTFAFYTKEMKKGTVDVRDPFLELVGDPSAADAKRAPQISKRGVVVPVDPLLDEIPVGDSDFTFSFIDIADGSRLTVSTRMDGDSEWRVQGEFPWEKNRIVARLTDMVPGKGQISAVLRNAKGETIASSTYLITVKELEPLNPGLRLNNLVTRLLTATAADGDYTFDMPKDGWIWISFAHGGQDLKVVLDGDEKRPVLVARPGERPEALRRVARGRHRLAVSGAIGGEWIVNRVPETSSYTLPLPIPQLKRENAYTGPFFDRYLLPVIGIWSCGFDWTRLPRDKRLDLKARGREWYMQYPRIRYRVANCGYLNRVMTNSVAFANSPFSGMTFDEIFIDTVGDKVDYIDILRKVGDKAVCPMATWSSGYKFAYTALDAEYLSTCINQARGRGRFQFECYPHADKTNETEACAYLDDMLVDSARRAQRLVPCVNPNLWVVLGTYTRIDTGKLCYDTAVECDYKRMVDLYLNRLAVRPELEGLGGVGIYCYSNAEEEDIRWLSLLFRHYCLEGKTQMPSERYSFSYRPGHLDNGAFTAGFDGWTIRPAAEGSMSVRAVKEIGKMFNYRPATRGGERACILKRVPGRCNRLEREIVNLVPGRFYSLRYAVMSLPDMKAKDPPTRDYGVQATMTGVEDVTEDAAISRYLGAWRARPGINVRFVIFRATEPTARLVIEDGPCATALPDEELAVTAIRVKPYFMEK